jgi:hypothetical protein
MTYHFLKIAPRWFSQVCNMVKSFEVRRMDRDYRVFDRLVLMEFEEGHYTGRYTVAKVRMIMTYEEFPEGLKEGYCILGICKEIYGIDYIETVLKPTAEAQGINTHLLEAQR